MGAAFSESRKQVPAATASTPAARHRSTTLPWRLTMYPTVHSFRTSGGVIATAEA
jgi:hypothetical protein